MYFFSALRVASLAIGSIFLISSLRIFFVMAFILANYRFSE